MLSSRWLLLSSSCSSSVIITTSSSGVRQLTPGSFAPGKATPTATARKQAISPFSTMPSSSSSSSSLSAAFNAPRPKAFLSTLAASSSASSQETASSNSTETAPASSSPSSSPSPASSSTIIPTTGGGSVDLTGSGASSKRRSGSGGAGSGGGGDKAPSSPSPLSASTESLAYLSGLSPEQQKAYYSIQFVNNNPRNLEMLGLASREKGYFHLIYTSKQGSHYTAYVKHANQDLILSASSREPLLRNTLYSTGNKSAAYHVGRLLAKRMAEAGILSAELRNGPSSDAKAAPSTLASGRHDAFRLGLRSFGITIGETTLARTTPSKPTPIPLKKPAKPAKQAAGPAKQAAGPAKQAAKQAAKGGKSTSE